MKILALEFSSTRRGVAVVECVPAVPNRRPDASAATDGDCKSPARDARVLGLAEADGMTPGPFELIESALSAAGVEREAIECIAVGLGPGSYTGIRSAIALAQGWQFATGVKLLGVSSADVLAATAHTAAVVGRVSVVINALRGEFYSAGYELGTDAWRSTRALRLVTEQEVEVLTRASEVLVTPDTNSPFMCAIPLRPSAGELGRLASQRSDFQPGEKLEPIYLRETTFVKASPPRRY